MHRVLAIVLPIVIPVVILLLLSLLRELLRVPGLKHVPDTGPDDMQRPPGAPTASDQWQQITTRWNGWITGPLTFLIGALVVALPVWWLTYLGWIATWVFDRPYALTVAPPWFGGGSSLLLSTFFGIVVLVLGVPMVGFAGFALHWIGRHTLWPNPGGGRH